MSKMRKRSVMIDLKPVNVAIIFGILFSGALTNGHAQWLDYRDARIPRTKDGKPNLTAPALRVNGKPDFSGLWQAERSPKSEYDAVLNGFTALQPDTYDITKNFLNIFWGMKPQDEPLRPEAAAILKHRQENPQENTFTRCLPGGIPAALQVLTFKIIQTPQEIVMLPEMTTNPPRQIYTDGRALPKDPYPTWMGYSVGRWNGDTLVVDTIGLNDQAWLDAFGHPRSESMHITERYRRRDFGHMDLEITFNDPTYYSRPFSIKIVLNLVPDSDLIEYVCNENERDRARLGK
jgi:hypothetical protein